ncbi:MAG TPA: hypothetical protein VK661_09750 [Planctomycetota bacterium]|nr:hypothetical protein [Planctomycetota bacterium]
MLRKLVMAFALSAAVAPMAGAPVTGPSSSQSPYIVPVAAGVEFTSILTVGDQVRKNHTAADTYRMVGIPDGLGAFDNGDGTITVLMNHELRSNVGVTRAHGAIGAFVSRWQIRKSDLRVLNGEDLMKNFRAWNAASETWVDGNGTAFSRFCSADLASPNAYFNSASDKGFTGGRIYMDGEEDDAAGRAVAHIVGGPQDGTSYELPKFGRHAWENLLASPFRQDKTIVVATEDGGLNKVFVYVGDKQEEGNPVEQAGLNNGTRYEVSIAGYTNDDPATGFQSAAFSLVTSGGTSLARPEDGAWDTIDRNRFYFVTTASITGNTRLWRLTFSDIRHPELGGTVEVLVNGNTVADPQIKMMDNITVDQDGNVYMQEDVGNNVRLGQIWRYSPKSGTVTDLAQHDSTRFITGASADIDGTSTKQSDEESSGIIDVTHLFNGVSGYDTKDYCYFLLDVQAHYTDISGTALAAELVEGGQLLLMRVPAVKHGNDKNADESQNEIDP